MCGRLELRRYSSGARECGSVRALKHAPREKRLHFSRKKTRGKHYFFLPQVAKWDNKMIAASNLLLLHLLTFLRRKNQKNTFSKKSWEKRRLSAGRGRRRAIFIARVSGEFLSFFLILHFPEEDEEDIAEEKIGGGNGYKLR